MPDPHIHTAQTQFWSLALQREVARNTIVEIGYSGAHGVHLYDALEQPTRIASKRKATRIVETERHLRILHSFTQPCLGL